MENFDVTIIGAGVVGLAIASELQGSNNLVIERHESFGKETSSRNSEVIHAGIYYPTGFLKAKLCVEGNRMMYEICGKNNIKHKKLGKIIVATNDDEAKDLEKLCKQGNDNGVPGLRLLDEKEAKIMEHNVVATAGLYSPSTGIFDTHGVMHYFEVKAKNSGCTFAYGCTLIAVEKIKSGYILKVIDSDGETYDFETKLLINCAGLNSDKVSAMVGLNGYTIHYCKGEYFKVSGGKSKYINHLVYPHPTDTSLGIHTVLDVQGDMKLGPNAFYVDSVDYNVDPNHGQEMYESAKKYIPFVDLNDLTPDMSGIRPKIQAAGEPVKDFIIRHEADKGFEGFINLIGIESPGLTSSPAIAKFVGKIVGG